MSFDLQTFYSHDKLNQEEIDSLKQAWTEEDIRQAICSWKGNKSPGPDGFTGEFYNTFVDILLPDIKEVFTRLNLQQRTTLHPLNDSFIVLVPKKEMANSTHDYRPISLINGIQKIYSKIMAAKLKPLLHRLLSPNQTGFLKNRSILHGFHYAQQIIQSASKQKVQLAVFKADIFKAFDTLHWTFLLNSLRARGFPQTWLDSIENRVLRGSSKIVLNAVAGKNIILKRGVRQGDPISPYLFNLSMDFLVKWIQRLTELNYLSPPFPHCRTCLLYADDTLLFIKPTGTQMIKIALLLHVFSQISGLKVNMTKSELAITSATSFLTQSLAEIVRCKPVSFPIKYLGLPLSDKTLTRPDYNAILDRMQARLTGWKASLLSIGGRIVLVNSVLSAIPQFFMSVFLLPKWMLRKVDQIRRKFLWHGNKEQQGRAKGLYMVSWALATRSRGSGGLGIRNTSIANQSLLAKWMWQWCEPSNAWWKEATPMANESDKPWDDCQASSFWKSIAKISKAFHVSVRFCIGNGSGTKLWHDTWHEAPLQQLFPDLYQLAHHKQCSISQCFQHDDWNIPTHMLTTVAQAQKDGLLLLLQQVQLTPTPDRLTWLRKGPTFTVSSFYNFLSHTPSPTSLCKNIWQIRAPFRVMVFAWLMLNNRLTTVDNLRRRGWYLTNMCVMCKANEESAKHLFQHCATAKEVRTYFLSTFGSILSISPKFVTAQSLQMLTDPKESKISRQLEIITCFVLWRERCRRIFSDKIATQIALVREIRIEHNSWFGQEPTRTIFDPR